MAKGKYKKKEKMTTKKEVIELINKNIETKLTSSTSGMRNYNAFADQEGDFTRIIPSIGLGNAYGERIGQTIKAQQLNVRGIINTIWDNPTIGGNYDRSRIGVRVICFSVKRYSNGEDAVNHSSDWQGSFIQDGATTRSLGGNIRTYLLPVNRRAITVHKDMRFTMLYPFTVNQGVGGTAVPYTVKNSTSTKSFNFNIPCNKILKYARATTQSPENFGPLICLSYTYLNDIGTVHAETTVQMETVTTLSYQDA